MKSKYDILILGMEMLANFQTGQNEMQSLISLIAIANQMEEVKKAHQLLTSFCQI